MASKQANYSTIPEAEQTEPMLFRIPGLRDVGNETFELHCRPLHIDGRAVENMLDDARIPREEALIYTERFLRMVQTGELARAIAERMERVG